MGSLNSEGDLIERTIAVMQDENLCVDPRHSHALKPLRFCFFGKCFVCEKALLGQSAIVKCVSCGILLHRSCRVSTPCRVNSTHNQLNINDDVIAKSKDAVFEEAEQISEETEYTQHEEGTLTDSILKSEQMDTSELTWTVEGPPQHWSEEDTAEKRPSWVPVRSKTDDVITEVEADTVENDVHPPLHQSLIQLSRLLNVVERFRQTNDDDSYSFESQGANDSLNSTDPTTQTTGSEQLTTPHSYRRSQLSSSELTRSTASLVSTNLAKFAQETLSNPWAAVAVAGGIAGGVALIGPAGALVAAEGALGALLEGSLSVSVMSACIATGGLTAQHLIQQERRILTMGEENGPKVYLVRPSIQMDPVWQEYVNKAKAEWGGQKSLLFPMNKSSDDSDIIADEELSTPDKVLLLVNRLLNDKESLPGYVYHALMKEFYNSPLRQKPRQHRDDAHAIIGHVTATLWQVRPGLQQCQELTARAVEGLVLGQVYDVVFDECRQETCANDQVLRTRILEEDRDMLEESACRALQMVPTAHLYEEKLQCCVNFLQAICRKDNVSADSLLSLASRHLIACPDDWHAQVSFIQEFARNLQGQEGYALVTIQACLELLNGDNWIDVVSQTD